jgi:hypothetical protein
MPRTRAGAILAGILLAVSAAAAPAAATIEGRWRLVDPGREAGRPGEAAFEAAPRLECALEGAALACRALTAEAPPRAFEWPAFVSEAGPLPVIVHERILDARTGRLFARYEVRLPPPGDRRLRIVEEYRLEDRGALAGTVRLTLVEDGEEAGSWVVRRRYEREP